MSKRVVRIFKAMPDQSAVHLPGSLGTDFAGDKKRRGKFKKMVSRRDKGQE